MTPKAGSAWPPLLAAAAALLAGALLLGAIPDAIAGERKRHTGGRIDPPALYHNYCSVCHGDNGDGNSRAKASLVPAPANFTDVALQGKYTAEYIAAIVRHGKPGTAMVSYTTQLSDAEIEALADYVKRSFVDHAGDESMRRGRVIYGTLCVGCHGVSGSGVATSGAASTPPPRDLGSDEARALGRDRIVAAIAVGRKGTAMNGFAGRLSGPDIDAVTDYVQKWIMASQGNISGISAHGGRERDPAR